MWFKYRPDKGFGWTIELNLGYLNISFLRYEDHWYFQIVWAKPPKVK